MGVKKTCRICREEKRIRDFYRNNKSKDGWESQCKKCRDERHKEAKKRYHEKHGYKKSDKEYLKKWREKNPHYFKLYYEQNKERVHQIQMAYQRRNRDRIRAHDKVMQALKKGTLIRPEKCQICAKTCKPEAHHHDYTKPLDIIWVCRPCHGDIHRKHQFKVRSNAREDR